MINFLPFDLDLDFSRINLFLIQFMPLGQLLIDLQAFVRTIFTKTGTSFTNLCKSNKGIGSVCQKFLRLLIVKHNIYYIY